MTAKSEENAAGNSSGQAKRAGGRIPHSSCIESERVPDSAPAIQIAVRGHADKKKSGRAWHLHSCDAISRVFALVRRRVPKLPELPT
jgi:hypothetical protein